MSPQPEPSAPGTSGTRLLAAGALALFACAALGWTLAHVRSLALADRHAALALVMPLLRADTARDRALAATLLDALGHRDLAARLARSPEASAPPPASGAARAAPGPNPRHYTTALGLQSAAALAVFTDALADHGAAGVAALGNATTRSLGGGPRQRPGERAWLLRFLELRERGLPGVPPAADSARLSALRAGVETLPAP